MDDGIGTGYLEGGEGQSEGGRGVSFHGLRSGEARGGVVQWTNGNKRNEGDRA